jgi:DNA-binding PadR family transcriptional regulator
MKLALWSQMYELIILSLLMRGPMHGYLIMKVTNDQIGPWAKISSGTLYPLLTRMEHAGLMSVVPRGNLAAPADHRSRTYAITDEGRKRFHQLMLDMSSNLGDYQKLFQYKMVYIDLLQPSERLLLFNHYVNYCQTSILYLQTEMEQLVYELATFPNPVYLENALRVMKHVEAQWQGELAWVKDLREREQARLETPSTNSSKEDAQGTALDQA